MGANQNFILSIRCITYNHSAYITDALNGFVMQQTSFPFLVVIIDDASTDGEQGIIREFIIESFDNSTDNGYKEWETEDANWTIARHKENENCWFLAVYLKKNLYRNPKKLELINGWMDTKYMALCEGDDYWTNPLKLQKQVCYLENHIECCMCSHAAEWEIEGEMKRWGCQHTKDCDLGTDEVIKGGGLYLATASLVFRSRLKDDMPKWRKAANVGDYPLQILGTLRGKLHFFSETMCVYRFQHRESWSVKLKGKDWEKEYFDEKVKWMKLLDEDTGFVYTAAIQANINKDRYKLNRELLFDHKITYREYFRSVRYYDGERKKKYKRAVKDLMIVRFGRIYAKLKLSNESNASN